MMVVMRFVGDGQLSEDMARNDGVEVNYNN